jgi:hypothetical protein
MARKRPRPQSRSRRQTPRSILVGYPPGAEPNYAPLLVELVRQVEGKLPPGREIHVIIYHDVDCLAVEGGVCNCDPEVELLEPIDPAAGGPVDGAPS